MKFQKHIIIVSPTRVSCGGSIKASIAKGKLIDKYRNQLRELRKCGLFINRQDKSKDNVTVCNVDCNDSYVWLKNNREPFTDVIEHWKKSYAKREQTLTTNVTHFIKEWPILSLPNGYILV